MGFHAGHLSDNDRTCAPHRWDKQAFPAGAVADTGVKGDGYDAAQAASVWNQSIDGYVKLVLLMDGHGPATIAVPSLISPAQRQLGARSGAWRPSALVTGSGGSGRTR